MTSAIAIQHDVSTGLYHPTIYRWSPLPGPEHDEKPDRYVSFGHHTTGFDDLEEAQAHAAEQRSKVEENFGPSIEPGPDGYPVYEVDGPGPHILILPSELH